MTIISRVQGLDWGSIHKNSNENGFTSSKSEHLMRLPKNWR